MMKLLLIEGQPGSGKSTFASKICNGFEERKIEFILNDEYEQDTKIFTDFWEDNSMKSNIAIQLFLSSWRKYISENLNENSIHIFDNSVLNHIQYLMAISTPEEEIIKFFRGIINIFGEIDTRMIFLDGNSEIVIRRIDEVRKNGWGERVASLFETYPYQQTRNREGKEGMIEFFQESQDLKRRVLEYWEHPLLKIDITENNWREYEMNILNFTKGYRL
jgi:uridine kinase